MADLGLTNAIRSLQMSVNKTSGANAGNSNIPITGTNMPNLGGFQQSSGGIWASPNDLKESIDNLNEGFEKNTGKFSKASEDWQKAAVGLGFKLSPFAESLQQFTKWSITRPIELMGGEGGRAARGGLERATGAGNIAFDIASAMAAFTGNVGVAAGIQLLGRSGGATMLGGLMFGQDRLAQAGLEQNVVQDYGAKQMQAEEAIMFRARSSRLQTQAGAWGGGLDVRGTISGLAQSLNEDPRVIQQALSEAFRIGGTAGIKNIDKDNITKLVQEGYGDAATLIAIQATAGRYGYGKGDVTGLADRAGLRPEEMLPLMQQTRMQYFMFGGNTAGNINRFVANTSIGAMNPSQGLSMVSQAAQGAAGVTDEATSMLQYQQFLQANPGSTYLDFVEAKKNGFADEKWRKFVGGAAAHYGAGGQMSRLIGAGVVGSQPGSLRGIGATYAEGLGPAANRTGARNVDWAEEERVQTRGLLTATALADSTTLAAKSMDELAGKIKSFTDQIIVEVEKMGLARDQVVGTGKVIAENTGFFGGLGGTRIDRSEWLPGG